MMRKVCLQDKLYKKKKATLCLPSMKICPNVETLSLAKMIWQTKK